VGEEPRLSRLLLRCGAGCDESLQAWLGQVGADAADSDFARELSAAAEALRRAAEGGRDDLAAARERCREAAGRARAAGLDDLTMRCAVICDQAALLCERALTEADRARDSARGKADTNAMS
jgi:hypothetical protein